MMTQSTRSTIGVLLALALCVALVSACSGKGKEKKDAEPTGEAAADATPKIVAAAGSFDFGKVKQGVDVEHVFKIRNEGAAELKIEKARGS
jgi:hypothetical protein